MKKILLLAFIVILIFSGAASALTWTSANGCWTATQSGYNLTMWNATGTTSWTVPYGLTNFSYVVIAGGGAGGSTSSGSAGGGGGGAGGVNATTTNITAIKWIDTWTISVGSGGTPSSNTGGGNGVASFIANTSGFFNISSVGGGGGGGYSTNQNGASGGSGGGSANTGTKGSGIAGQGQNGNTAATTGTAGGGGGGGNSTAGSAGTTTTGGNGGNGYISNITGSSITYAGGGGGGVSTSTTTGTGGTGGGGNGGSVSGGNGVSGTPATGSGGGGSSPISSAYLGGTGGSGLIIISYLLQPPNFNAAFTISPNPAYAGQTVTAIDTTTGAGSPYVYNWSWGDGSTSTLQNPTHSYSSIGSYTIWDNVTNSTGSWSNTSLTETVTTAPIGTNSSILISNLQIWNGAAVPTTALYPPNPTGTSIAQIPAFQTTSQNPSHTYTVPGTYTPVETVLDSYGGWAQVNGSVVVGIGLPYASFTESTSSGNAGNSIGFTFTGYAPSTPATTFNWSWGDSAGTDPFSSQSVATGSGIQHVYAYNGIFYPNLTLSNANGTSYYNGPAITISSNSQSQTTFYSPYQVGFQIVDANLNPIVGTPVIALANQTTLPGGNLTAATTFLEQAYGVTPTVAAQMLSATTEYTGNTDTTGSVSILMISTIQYNVCAEDTTSAWYCTQIYPTQQNYQIKTLNASVQSQAATAQSSSNLYNGQSIFNTTFTEPNSSYGTMGVQIYDATGKTDGANVWFTLVDNGTTWWNNQTWPYGSGIQLINFTVPYVPYQQWRWGAITI